MNEPYAYHREAYGSVSGTYRVQAADTGLITLVPLILLQTIFLQKLHIQVTTLTAAELWTIQDGAAVLLVPNVSAAAVAHFDFDFGPQGSPCTEAQSLVLNVTGATGAVGTITWEAYKKLTRGAPPLVG
jgi:hypothetical protein